MLIIACILCIAAVVAAVVSCLIYRRSIQKLLGRILERLEDAIAGNRTPVEYNEGLESAIGEKMNQFLAIAQETTKKTEQEREIIRAFLSDVTHQVKTPLSNILVYSQLLEGQADMGTESREMLDQIQQQAEKLDFLVHHLKKASQLELEMIKLHLESASIDELIWSVCQLAEPSAQKKDIHIRWEHCEQTCRMDMRWMQEALGNILDNAVKYSPEGGDIEIRFREYEIFYRIDVLDQGPGIPEEEQGLVFQRFYRSEATSRQPGLGIGLYLTREIVAKHGGYVEVHCKDGEGACFSVYLRRD